MSKPHLELVRGWCVHNYTCDLMSQLKLLSNQTKQQIFPEQVWVPFFSTEAPCTALWVFRILPHRLNSLNEDIDNGLLIVLTGTLDVLVHVPELLHGWKACKWFQLFFVEVKTLFFTGVDRECLMQILVLRGLLSDGCDSWVVNNFHLIIQKKAIQNQLVIAIKQVAPCTR